GVDRPAGRRRADARSRPGLLPRPGGGGRAAGLRELDRASRRSLARQHRFPDGQRGDLDRLPGRSAARPGLVSPAVRCGGLERRFGDRLALAGVDLEVGEGQVVLLTGPNGAGKTTLLRILATVLKPTAGTAEVSGHELPKEATAVRGRVGYAGHEALVYPGLTARENLELYAALHGSPEAAVAGALDRVGLATRATTRVSELSRGMRQRL